MSWAPAQLFWHRLVLDEAQMVGGNFSNVALMAQRIGALNRWAVGSWWLPTIRQHSLKIWSPYDSRLCCSNTPYRTD